MYSNFIYEVNVIMVFKLALVLIEYLMDTLKKKILEQYRKRILLTSGFKIYCTLYYIYVIYVCI